MSWLFYRWLAVCGISSFVFKGGQSLFLRHIETGKCIATSEELVYDAPDYSLPYFVVMTDNCLNNKAEFRYLDSQLLQNIEKEGTLISPRSGHYKNRWAVYKGVAVGAKKYQQRAEHRIKQTAAGSLFFYSIERVCAEPDSSNYVLRKTSCGTTKQTFTLGSITAYNAKMENVHCSPIQRMMVKSADYAEFNNSGTFNKNATIDTQCSKLTNCQVKSLCGGNRSCELTMDNNLLPSHYCSNTSKQIYTKYTCVDAYNSSAITTAPSIRLTSPNAGHIEIKHGSNWRRVVEENWDLNRQKMLCQHLGFEEINGNRIETRQFGSVQQIVTGDLMCYNTQPSRTSCCVHLEPSTSTASSSIPYVRCKICNNPLLHNAVTFPDSMFSGSGDSSSKYKDARITKGGWCPSGSGSAHLLLDLQKEYHITEVVVMADKEQTKWSGSYSLKYSHNTSYKNIAQISGNQNGYQASRTSLDIYNVRYVKIESTGNQDFCLRIELCGEVQTPAPVSNINVSPSRYSANVSWQISASTKDSSYITKIIIYLNGQELKNISRGTQVTIDGLLPYTSYTVGIETQDGSSQKSNKVIKTFKTSEAVKCADCENTKQSNREEIRIDLIIPLVISISCFLLSLGVNIYQRRLIQSNKEQKCHKCEASEQAQQMTKFDSLSNNKRAKDIKASPKDQSNVTNDEAAYELPDSECTGQDLYQAEPEISTGQESPTYMSLKDNREPENVYQSLQRKKDIAAVKYENPAFTGSGK